MVFGPFKTDYFLYEKYIPYLKIMSFPNFQLTTGRKFSYQNRQYIINHIFNLPNGEFLIYYDRDGKTMIVNAHEVVLIGEEKEK